jgi:hypothetical protein
VPLEALAERATRVLGHERTIGSRWAGAGYFIELLRQGLPSDVLLSEEAPFYAYDGRRQLAGATAPTLGAIAEPAVTPAAVQQQARPAAPQPAARAPQPLQEVPMALARHGMHTATHVPPSLGAPLGQPSHSSAPGADTPRTRLIARIAQASGVPALSTQSYRHLFDAMVEELVAQGLQGERTFANIVKRLEGEGVSLKREEIKLVFDVVSKPDPWFEKGVDTAIFANRFRNHMIAACRDRGVVLSAVDLDVIDDLVLGRLADEVVPPPAPQQQHPAPGARFNATAARQASQPTAVVPEPTMPQQPAGGGQQAGRWWALKEKGGAEPAALQPAAAASDDSMPRFVRNRGR